MNNNKYYPRIIDRQFEDLLESIGAVLIEGAKWCGKTSSAKQKSKSMLFLQDTDKAASYSMAIETKPSVLLRGKTPRLIDEWQMYPVLWDAIRFEVDKRQHTGQFILTGSAVPLDNAVLHTGTGRIARMLMRPMSLFESKDSNGAVSLGQLFEGHTRIEGICDVSIEQIAYLICRGGWPGTLDLNEKAALRMASTYVDAVIHADVHRVDGTEKNPERVRLLLRSLARNISTTASAKTIMHDVAANDMGMTEKTYLSYMNALRRIFVVEDSSAWQPSLRSKTAIRTSAKRHFVDPSIATAVLRINPDKLFKDFEMFGFLFEALCTRDMRIYAQANDGNVYHYRDKSGLEADMIIQLNDGRWAAIEVKMGSKQIEEAAANLLKLKEKVNADKMGDPVFLMILTGGDLCFQRKDGVLVVPVGCLRE